MRAGLLLVASAALAALTAQPAAADCTPNGLIVTCASPGTGGLFDPGGDNLVITVQPGATVVDAGGFGIVVRDFNTITNNGTILATGNATAIRAATDNIVTNNGTIQIVDGSAIELNSNTALPAFSNVINNGAIVIQGNGTGILVANNHRILNAGTIAGGAGSVGIASDNGGRITNTGTITIGPGDSGVQLVADGNIFNNSGTVRVTGSGFSIEACPCTAINNVFNNLAGGTLDGLISVTNRDNTVNNSGLIIITDPATPIGAFNFTIQNTAGNGATNPNTYTQTATGTLALRMNNAGAIDSLIADAITLNGTLRVVIQPQLYPQTLLSANSAIDIVPGGTVTTTFSSYKSSSPFFTVTPFYTGSGGLPNDFTSLSIQLDRIAFNAVPNLTPNQKAVGTALEGAYSPGLTGNAATFFSNLFAATSIGALDLLSGEGTSALQSASFNIGSLFNSTMQNQGLNGDFSGATTVTIPPAQFTQTPRARGQEAFASLKSAEPAAAPAGRWRIWTLGFGAYRSLDGNPSVGSANQTMRNYGGALGFDYQVSPDLLLGFSAGGSESSISVPSLLTNGQVTGGHLGIYGVKTWGALYGAATLSYARLDNSTSRTIVGVGPTETATGRFASDQLGARLELGWKKAFAAYTLTPFVAIEPAALWARGYTEGSATGGGILGLTFASRTTTSLPTFVGLQAETRTVLGGGEVFAPYARLSWVHEFLTDRSLTATFISVPAATFSVDGARIASDAARLDAGAKFSFDATRSIFANMTGEWSNVGHSYAATADFKLVR